MAEERLQKVLAARGVASRRGSEELIAKGRVRVNGEVVKEMGVKVDPDRDMIEVDGVVAGKVKGGPVVVILNKPAGYTTTVSDPHAEHTVMELVDLEGRRVYPVGRLDRESRGLLLLTDDGDLAYKLTHPSHGVEKSYRVWARGKMGQKEIERMTTGIELEDGTTAPAKVVDVRIEGQKVRFDITIKEGKKRQIRRMVRALGGHVHDLYRFSFGGIEIGDRPEGGWRHLSRRELAKLRGEAAKVKTNRGRRGSQKRSPED
ncbi:MAG: pseudouridine synthase [Deltaproteobacteria bacterium]|nr:MAG: pseudouridine synthase [Deltaproteobacteria bacterium]